MSEYSIIGNVSSLGLGNCRFESYYSEQMSVQVKKLRFFKKNKKNFRLNRLYLELLKTKHLLKFFLTNLKTKQLLKMYRVLSKRQFFFNFLIALEKRLDFILIKANFALTGKQVQQLILHGHVLLNGKVSRVPSCIIKEYDFISLVRSSILSYKGDLVKSLFKTPIYFSFLRRKKKIFKKAKLIHLFVYFKFSFFLEINFRIFTIFVFSEPRVQESFLGRVSSLYDYNQLNFIL